MQQQSGPFLHMQSGVNKSLHSASQTSLRQGRILNDSDAAVAS